MDGDYHASFFYLSVYEGCTVSPPTVYIYNRRVASAPVTQRSGVRSRVRFRKREKEMAMSKAKEIVSSNPVVVFSKSYCPFCVEVKKLLNELGATFKAIELDTESDGNEIQTALAEWTGLRTVPNVFIAGNHIGGCDKTTAMHNEGKLVPLLTEAGAVAKTST